MDPFEGQSMCCEGGRSETAGSGSTALEPRPSDVELLERFEGGEPAAFEELFRRYRQPLFRFILRFLHDESASHDAVQDVFIKVLREPGRFESRSRFSTWLHAVARNLCLDLLRKRKLRDHLSLDQPAYQGGERRAGPPLVERIPSGGASTETEAARRGLRLKLLVAIRSVPREQRQVFLLREVVGLPFAEIAGLTGVPVNTAKSRMRYALGALRRALAELGVEADSL